MSLAQNILVGTKLRGIVRNNNLIIVVLSGKITVNTVSDHQSLFAADRRKGNAVNARATEAVLTNLSVMLPFIEIIIRRFTQKDRRHHAVRFRIHSAADNFFPIEYRNVKGVFDFVLNTERTQNALADLVVFVFKRSIDSSVLLIVSKTSEVTQKSAYGTDLIAVHIQFDKLGRKGAIDIFSLFINGDSLYMSAAINARANDFR